MPSTAGLDPDFRPWADYILAVARYYGGPYVITSAYRTYADQERLYQRYLAGESGGLPAARPGTSAHELGYAVDIAQPGVDPLQDPFLRRLGEWWAGAGGTWGASDPVHFEWPH